MVNNITLLIETEEWFLLLWLVILLTIIDRDRGVVLIVVVGNITTPLSLSVMVNNITNHNNKDHSSVSINNGQQYYQPQQ
jgi:hypothetical protein